MEGGDEYFLSHADGSVCPDLNWCYYQYYKIFKTVYGPNYGEGMVEKLQEAVHQYNLDCQAKCAEVFVDNEDIVVALCTPLMKRVHELLESSSEVAIMDFSGNMDRYDTRIGFLIAPSLAGGLPLGIIMTSSESEVLVTKGLKMLQNLYPEKAFYGRGELGPKVFITDAAKNERNSLASLYPFATLLLCYFHTLQAFLRYITQAEHKVKKDDRVAIYDKYKDLVRSKSDEHFENNYQDFIASEILQRNRKVYDHVKDAYPNRQQWASCYRSDLIIRGNNTSNLAEANFLLGF
ncbi:Protein FAR-RED IMPAIRED RESPONSE 1 [Frankliniella fusca]|uniref:Protein FAR-RED IMPAIRED RESPONSE 1 n=1 Tax=Frankliniella fusca TaxID=407009 RepID=A0AAE1LNZ8_9NEOP|nr:Protein FAR-RED IMPAIRED RESPONSE 1 [Frankliniella fusca]